MTFACFRPDGSVVIVDGIELAYTNEVTPVGSLADWMQLAINDMWEFHGT